LVPQEYVEALSTLQDRVPPFPGDEAKALLLSEMGPEKFSKLSSIKFEKGPVAR
jgi:predicted unusual protein kinase regulating ubiquinone biosynthesis (AarF/ABC1/UbiB family)